MKIEINGKFKMENEKSTNRTIGYHLEVFDDLDQMTVGMVVIDDDLIKFYTKEEVGIGEVDISDWSIEKRVKLLKFVVRNFKEVE